MLNVELCNRKMSQTFPVFSYDLFELTDKNGGAYTQSGTSWNEWPPRPQFPSDLQLLAGRCTTGWLLFSVPRDVRVELASLSDGGGGFSAEWVVP